MVWAVPLSLAATDGIEFSFSSTSYLDVSVHLVCHNVPMNSAHVIQESPDHRLFVNFPGLIADFHALHRLLMPRHPPYTLSSLTTNIQPSRANHTAEAAKLAEGESHTCCSKPQIQINDIASFLNLLTSRFLDSPSPENRLWQSFDRLDATIEWFNFEYRCCPGTAISPRKEAAAHSGIHTQMPSTYQIVKERLCRYLLDNSHQSSAFADMIGSGLNYSPAIEFASQAFVSSHSHRGSYPSAGGQANITKNSSGHNQPISPIQAASGKIHSFGEFMWESEFVSGGIDDFSVSSLSVNR